MSLRARILAITVSLVTTGLLVADVVTYHFLGSYLLDRVDEQLETVAPPLSRGMTAGLLRGLDLSHVRPFEGQLALSLSDGAYAAILNEDGSVATDLTFAYTGEQPKPRLPSDLPSSAAARSPFDPLLLTTDAESGSRSFRVLATPLGTGQTLVLARPLDEIEATQRRLLLIEGGVTLALILLAAAAGLWLTRVELRPLERMGETAGAIAAGDLSRGVEPDNPRTEVGRLGAALNSMLTQIEHAFAERSASEERLRRFLADASHELRTPLTSIRGYAELFRRGGADRPDDLATIMRRIEEEGERMGALVDELLLLARLDQGLPLERQPVDLVDVATSSVDAARASNPERPIDLDARPPVVVLGSDARLRQVVDNLLGNARVHTPAGTPVHVRVTAREGKALVEVTDEGPGIPPEDVARIFERFYRIDRSRSRAHGGVGLGLAIIRSVVEAHGGSVTYRPRPEGGASFQVSLPLAGARKRASTLV